LGKECGESLKTRGTEAEGGESPRKGHAKIEKKEKRGIKHRTSEEVGENGRDLQKR